MYQAELQRLEGDLMLLQRSEAGRDGDDEELLAQACFERAIETARRQGARSLELRAVLSRSRVWLHQGRTAEARAVLARICATLGDGRDGDLDAALALLEKLSP
jgi:predicted ATPase